MGQIDIIEIGYEPSTSERLFILYLFIVACIMLVRMCRMAWHLWSLRGRKEFSGYESHDPERIVKAAIRGLLKREPDLSNSETKIHLDETQFLFLWETYYAKVQSTKTLAFLTAVLSLSVAAFGICNICIGITTEDNVGLAVIAGAGRNVFAMLAVGLLVSASLFSISLLFEGTLSRRRRDWNYLRARLG